MGTMEENRKNETTQSLTSKGEAIDRARGSGEYQRKSKRKAKPEQRDGGKDAADVHFWTFFGPGRPFNIDTGAGLVMAQWDHGKNRNGNSDNNKPQTQTTQREARPQR